MRREELVEVEGIDIDGIDFQREALRLVARRIDHDLQGREIVESAVPRGDGIGLADGHALSVVEDSGVGFADFHDFHVGDELLSLLNVGQAQLLAGIKCDAELQVCLLSDEELQGVELDIDLHLGLGACK